MPEPLDLATVESLLLGKLPPQQSEPLLLRLADHAELAGVAERLAHGDDTLVDALRGASTRVGAEPDPRVAALIDRLARLWDAGRRDETSPSGEGTIVVESKVAARAMPFLSPSLADDELGRLGGLRILRVLGQGGMGMVFLAEDPRLKRQVAVKVMKPEYAANEQARERFLREARATAQVEHDHVIAVHQVNEEGGVPFLVMPLLKGESLEDRLKHGPRPALAETLRVGREIAEGLAAAHATGLIHRDIKPSNVWLESRSGEPGGSSPRSRVKILDFGLARSGEGRVDERLTQSGAVVGTPSYMAPEQANGDPVDGRGDLFSLGCVLYQMTTGHKPFGGQTVMAILASLASHHPAPPAQIDPSIPVDLSNLIMALLAKHRDQRPANARQVADALAGIEETLKRPMAVPVAQAVDDTELMPANPWADIDDDSQPPAPASGGRKPPEELQSSSGSEIPPGAYAPRSPRLRPAAQGAYAPRSPRTWLVASGLVALLVAVLFAAGVIRIETPKGTLVIEGVDDDVEVVISKVGATIKDKVKAREIELKVGDYTIELAEQKEGLRLSTKEFTITRGKQTPIKVSLEKPKVPPVKVDPDRRAAEWVLRGGGNVEVRVGQESQVRGIDKLDQLPPEPFRVVGLYYPDTVGDAELEYLFPLAELSSAWGLQKVEYTDASLERLSKSAAARNIAHLRLPTRVTDAGVTYLGRFPRLQHLAITGESITDKGLAHLGQLSALQRLDIYNCRGITDAGLKHLKGLKLNGLSLSGPSSTDAGLRHFAGMTMLENVGLQTSSISDNGLTALDSLPQLLHLSLMDTRVTDAGMESVAKHTNLKHLDLTACPITDAGLDRLKALSKLEWLDVQRTKVTADGVKKLAAALPQCRIDSDHGTFEPKNVAADPDRKAAEWALARGGYLVVHTGAPDPPLDVTALDKLPARPFKVLNFNVAEAEPKITDADLEMLRPLTELSTAILNGAEITDAGVERLTQFPAAKNFTDLKVHSNRLTDAAMASCARLERLETLALGALGGERFSDAGLDHLRRMPSLKRVRLYVKVTDAGVEKLRGLKLTELSLHGDGNFSDAGVRRLADMTTLEILAVTSARVTGAGFADLGRLTVLKDLRLGYSRIDDAGLAGVCALTQLERLNLVGTLITDAGLERLKVLTKLTYLDVRVTKAKAEGVKKLSAALPNCKIDSDHGAFGPK